MRKTCLHFIRAPRLFSMQRKRYSVDAGRGKFSLKLGILPSVDISLLVRAPIKSMMTALLSNDLVKSVAHVISRLSDCLTRVGITIALNGVIQSRDDSDLLI